jgi:hypothetical protein
LKGFALARCPEVLKERKEAVRGTKARRPMRESKNVSGGVSYGERSFATAKRKRPGDIFYNTSEHIEKTHTNEVVRCKVERPSVGESLKRSNEGRMGNA